MFFSYVSTFFRFLGLGMLFGFFPGYFAWIFYIARAATVYHKAVPKWMLYLSGWDQQTQRFSFNLNRSLGSHFLIWAIFVPWILMCVVFTPHLAAANADGNTVKKIIIDIIYPVALLGMWLLPSLLLDKYLKQLKPRDELDMEMERQQ